jgi:hypothetical protein
MSLNANGKPKNGILYADARNLKLTEPFSGDDVSMTVSVGTGGATLYMNRTPRGKKRGVRAQFTMHAEALLALRNLLNGIEIEVKETPSYTATEMKLPREDK